MMGDPRAARELFQRATALAPGRIDLSMGLAACERSLGDPAAALAAVEGALKADPRLFPALLMKGALLEQLGLEARAAAIYGTAIDLSPPPQTLAEPTRRALEHGREVREKYTSHLAACLKAEAGVGETTALGRRIETFIEAASGRRKMFHQEPMQFHYPGMPAIEFYDREEFPWLEALEARTAAIREEVLNVWTEGSPELAPYVSYPDGLPLDQWVELNHSLRWSAFHLWADGAPVEANCAKCPQTTEAIKLIDQPHVHGRSPAAMFSILRPRTRIPPHTGVANTRLVLHLPLIVPEECGFRVGGETRQWREGEAWVFDDTIEHEAWNNSDKPRAVLICDVWSPRLSGEERELIARLLAALDRLSGGAEGSGAL